MQPLLSRFTKVALFAIAMGCLEAIVVVYLRELFYPQGFDFPLHDMPPHLILIELSREVATVVMLLMVGHLAGNTALQRFAFFAIAFAVWDIFYYVFLFIFLQWPSGLATWDILFLIPLPWVGPVWAPLLLAITMIAGSCHYLWVTGRGIAYPISRLHWFLLLSGSLLCILAFVWDYLQVYLLQKGNTQALLNFSQVHVPQIFQTELFLLGYALLLAPFLLIVYQLHKNQTHEKK